MNTQIISKIEIIEKELEELKVLIKADEKNKSTKKRSLSGLWKDQKNNAANESIADGLKDYHDGKVNGTFKNMKEFKASLKKN